VAKKYVKTTIVSTNTQIIIIIFIVNYLFIFKSFDGILRLRRESSKRDIKLVITFLLAVFYGVVTRYATLHARETFLCVKIYINRENRVPVYPIDMRLDKFIMAQYWLH